MPTPRTIRVTLYYNKGGVMRRPRNKGWQLPPIKVVEMCVYLTGCPSTKIFKVAPGHKTKATKTATMGYKLQEPARIVDMVPGVVLDSLASTSKFYDSEYITLVNEEEVNVWDARTTTVNASKPPIFSKGGRTQSAPSGTPHWSHELLDPMLAS